MHLEDLIEQASRRAPAPDKTRRQVAGLMDGLLLLRQDTPSALEFINHSGDIELVVPANAAAAVSIDTFEGEFQDEFGVPAKQTPGKVKGRQFSFTIGRDPGAEVAIRNFKGVVILRKAAVVKT